MNRSLLERITLALCCNETLTSSIMNGLDSPELPRSLSMQDRFAIALQEVAKAIHDRIEQTVQENTK